jgi:hypothetical protein
MLFDAKSGWPPTPAHLRVYVADAVQTVEQSLAAGARLVTLCDEMQGTSPDPR